MKEYELFQQYVKRCGNPYLAVQHIATEARRRAAECNDIILHSEALSWVIRGERPSILDKYTAQNTHPRNLSISYIDDVLSCVDDEQVCNSVRSSLKYSNFAKHLIYLYRGVFDKDRQARVRILTRMIWYHLHND